MQASWNCLFKLQNMMNYNKKQEGEIRYLAYKMKPGDRALISALAVLNDNKASIITAYICKVVG